MGTKCQVILYHWQVKRFLNQHIAYLHLDGFMCRGKSGDLTRKLREKNPFIDISQIKLILFLLWQKKSLILANGASVWCHV